MRIDLFSTCLGLLPAFAVLGLAASATAQEAGERMPIGTNFWNISWHRADDVFRGGWQNVTGENPWNPVFLEQVEPYSCFRFMDWDGTNHSPRVTWSDRPSRDNPEQNPVAYEWMIDLCNRKQADFWVTLPHQAQWAYSHQLAELLKEKLDPGLKIYVEYSNETWNGMFRQTQYCEERGSALDLPGVSEKEKGWAYHVYAAVRHFEQFQQVFGEDSDRVVYVIAGFVSNPGVAEHHVKVLQDEQVNPKGFEPDAYAIAPYFGHHIDPQAEDAVEQLYEAMDDALANCARHREVLEGTGMKLIAYEAGQHTAEPGAPELNRRQVMYDVYMDYLTRMDEHMQGVFAHYVHVGARPENKHMWGALEYTCQSPEEAPKYRAILDYLRSE
ncbi:MAG: hypothetical protein ACOCTI_04095 [Phycisphaeraceae bacterium]